MPNTRDIWKFWFLNKASGLCYYEDSNGNPQTGNPLLGLDFALKHVPQGWDSMQLSFGRNSHYWGINRSFSNTFMFIEDAARILRRLLYLGKGIEAGVVLIVAKWDDETDVYRLYYDGMIDFSKCEDLADQGIKVDTLEGGVIGMLKANEQTVQEIECDGSIPENIKINDDGILFDDVFHYQILNITAPFPGVLPLPCTFISNDGDNIGITRGDQLLELPSANYFQQSGNFLFSSTTPIKVRLQGFITVKTDWRIANTGFYMFTATSNSVGDGIGGTTHGIGLVNPQVNANGNFEPVKSQINVNGQRVFGFDAVISLAANENLFVMFFNDFADHPIQILGGSFSLSFSSRYPSARIWGMTMWDLFRLIVTRNNALSASTAQTFDFDIDSPLLKEKLNWVVTSGDAIRASTDPNYFQYYNQSTINPANPGNQFFNARTFLGPAIKSNLSDLFDTVNAIACAALYNTRPGPGARETIVIDRKKTVMDSSVITMNVGQVSNLRISLALEYFFNWVKVGYIAQQYDEKAGKFEYNNTSQYQASIKSLAKILELISKYRTDSYGEQYTKFNTQGGKSTTFNDSDSSVFLYNVDFSKSIADYFLATFVSSVPDPTSLTTTDQKLIANQNYQPLVLPVMDGNYFVNAIDFSIFMFNQAAPGNKDVNINFTALLNGLPGDSATIKMFIAGVVVQSWTQAITGVNTAFNRNITFNRDFVKGDSLWFTVDTVKTCSVSITAFVLTVGVDYFVTTSAGNIDIAATSSSQLISLPILTPQHVVVHGLQIPVVSFGFQYFKFLSPVHNSNFDWAVAIAGYIQAQTGEHASFDVWYNGQNLGTVTLNGNANLLQQFNAIGAPFLGNITFNLYDLFWITASATNTNCWVTTASAQFTSTAIRAYPPLRKVYDSITGVPNPQTAQNIEDFTPARMIRANSGLLAAVLYNQAPGKLTFQTADKNQFLSTTLNGETIQENADIDIHDLGDPFFYPFFLDFDTDVPVNFADLLTGQANGHIQLQWGRKTLYGFPIQVTSKPALNESQSWKLLCSPKTNLADLVDLDWDGIITLQLMDTALTKIQSLHWVPLNYQKDPRYNSFTMDEDWYKNRITTYADTTDYFAPWQMNDFLMHQTQTNGLDPVTIQVLDGNGENLGDPIDVPNIPTGALQDPQKLYQLRQALAAMPEGQYYFLQTMGVGEGMASWISEGIWVKQKWDRTLLFEYFNQRNRLGIVFKEGAQFCRRIHGMIGRYTPQSVFVEFVEQSQGVIPLGGIGYDTYKLMIGIDVPVPDYMERWVDRIFNFDTVLINGNQYTRDTGAKWDKVTWPGQAREILTLSIRPANNSDFTILNTANQLTDDLSGGYVVEPTVFGQSQTDQPLIKVTNDPE